MPPQCRIGVDGRLLDGETGEGIVLIDVEVGAQRVDAGRLEPLLGPVTQFAAGRGFQLGEQVRCLLYTSPSPRDS